MKVREYRPDDHSSCLELFDSNVPEFFQPEEREEYGAFLRDLPGPYFVVTDRGGEIVGCGGFAVKAGTRTADLCWGMVHSQVHGQGYGGFLTRVRIERILDDATIGEVALNTSQHTVGFYEVMGFETIEVRKDGYGPGLDRCEMRMPVSGRGRPGT